ncbi:unnamed protein product [Owenia fusiformis]|uniref:Carboxylic ester hydrolase n=1 Tax=Owenia fusiformis TaxID=6347 RepID=A0A8J1UA61_OWEFU|nr:unnamed protein product [Owenia fusiformis]
MTFRVRTDIPPFWQLLWRQFIAFLFLHLIILASAARNRDDLVKNTDKGKVRGTRVHLRHMDKRVDTFLGIPYAKPPLGDLRFRHPEPMDRWQGIRDATQQPNTCVQLKDDTFGNFSGSTMWNANTPISEDCLYLNVYVPKNIARHSAVVVWIYGGAFYSGSITLDIYDPTIFAAYNDVIVVAMNYRVGILGYLSLGIAEAPGNAGMFDQLMALEWVRKNIRSFGGNPNNVTLLGESAGSVSVSMHLLSPLSRNKFNRAILQSGVANTKWATITVAEAKTRAFRVAKRLRCAERQETKKLDELGVFTCLRNTKSFDLSNNEYYATGGTMQFAFVPVIDGVFLVEDPRQSLKRHNFKKCPILIGSNKNEGSYFLMYDLSDRIDLETKADELVNREFFIEAMQRVNNFYPQYPHQLNTFGLDAIIHQYTPWENPDDKYLNFRAIDNCVGDYHFLCQVNEFAQAYANFGENVYSYYYSHRSSLQPWPIWIGVMHADEINFVFGEPLRQGYNYTRLEVEFSKKVMNYWTNFAKYGDPNQTPDGYNLQEWPVHTKEGKEIIELNAKFVHETDKTLALGRGPRLKECAFWREYLPQLVAATANITEEEKSWKLEFSEWRTQYIVDWKQQYDNFIRAQQSQCESPPP